MLNIDMDLGHEWEKKWIAAAYPSSATWFIFNTKVLILAFCIPPGLL